MSDIWLLLEVYWFTILTVTISGILLAQLGGHLAGRDQSLQVFCISQGALSGALIGLLAILLGFGAEAVHDSVEGHSIIPNLTALLFAGGLSLVLNNINRSQAASRNTIFVALFCGLTAVNALISRLFPILEQQFSRVFFGDFTTASVHSLEIIGLTSLIGGVYYLKNWQRLSRQTFEYAFFGFIQTSKRKGSYYATYLAALGYICVCIQTLGFLGTLVLLFLPTVLVKSWPSRGLAHHLVSISLVAGIAIPLGFLTGFILPDMPTISLIVLCMIFVTLLGQVFSKLRRVNPQS